MLISQPYVGLNGAENAHDIEGAISGLSLPEGRLVKVDLPMPEHFGCIRILPCALPEGGSLGRQLAELAVRHDGKIDGFELTDAWPSTEQLSAFRVAHPAMSLVLRVGLVAQLRANVRASELAARLNGYVGIVDVAILYQGWSLEPSFSVNQARSWLKAIRERCGESLRLGLGGNIRPDTMPTIASILADWPGLSIDPCARQFRTLTKRYDDHQPVRFEPERAAAFLRSVISHCQ